MPFTGLNALHGAPHTREPVPEDAPGLEIAAEIGVRGNTEVDGRLLPLQPGYRHGREVPASDGVRLPTAGPGGVGCKGPGKVAPHVVKRSYLVVLLGPAQVLLFGLLCRPETVAVAIDIGDLGQHGNSQRPAGVVDAIVGLAVQAELEGHLRRPAFLAEAPEFAGHLLLLLLRQPANLLSDNELQHSVDAKHQIGAQQADYKGPGVAATLVTPDNWYDKRLIVYGVLHSQPPSATHMQRLFLLQRGVVG
mmetsp:Transcript_82059/g.265947  ORF Transcript_82059/g.265947 Transcript_82059/m.265947 type:complete len:249 (-) Transcript_82059:147-893(-)